MSRGFRNFLCLHALLWSAKNPSSCQVAGCESALDDHPASCDNSRRRPPSLQGGITAMATFPHWPCHLQQLAGTLLALVVDVFRYAGLCLRSPAVLAAENLFLREQLAFYRERHVAPRRAAPATRIALVWLGRW